VSSQKILIVGGYGVVGTRIAAQLPAEYPGCVVIGGRNLERADDLAKSIGHGVRGRKIDITAPATIASALEDIAVVISCIDQPSRTLLWAPGSTKLTMRAGKAPLYYRIWLCVPAQLQLTSP
jgi:saccharopine dehydrogenase-like NADP-dependent oxidoreductase